MIGVFGSRTRPDGRRAIRYIDMLRGEGGGTSRAVFLREADIPQDEDARRRLVLRIFGSPDKRQIDGLGGADPLTSKLAIIGPPRDDPRAAGTHLTYTFGQVAIDHPEIDYLSLCGNISAAVGAFAVYEGLVQPQAPVTIVRAFNTNLNRVLRIEVPVGGGRPLEAGSYAIPGVPGTDARILIDFADTAGGATGRVLPTGNPVDTVDVEGHGPVEMSLVDIGNAQVFVRAADLGLRGTEAAAEIDARPDLRKLLERIRGAGTYRMGMVTAPGRSRDESPATPLIAMISPPADYHDALNGRTGHPAGVIETESDVRIEGGAVWWATATSPATSSPQFALPRWSRSPRRCVCPRVAAHRRCLVHLHEPPRQGAGGACGFRQRDRVVLHRTGRCGRTRAVPFQPARDLRRARGGGACGRERGRVPRRGDRRMRDDGAGQ